MWLLAGACAWAGSPSGIYQEALAGLPPLLSERAAELRVEHGPAPSLPAELRAPHLLVREGPRQLLVLDEGLETQVAEWVSAQGVEADPRALSVALLQRQLAHGLAHSLEREQPLSGTERWRALSDWGAFGPGERDPLSFGGPGAMDSPREDLALAAEHWATGLALPGDPTLEAPCRMRSKLDLIEGAWGPSRAYRRCSQLEAAGLAPGEIVGLELLLVQASSQDPSSVGGHLMLGVRHRPDEHGITRLETFTLVALTGDEDEGSAAYIAKGVAGGFPSVVRREPYRLSVLRYAQENRGIQRLALDLDAQQLRRALERLDELRQAWSRPYLFFTRNCTQLPREILEAALQESLGLPGFYTPDALVGAIERRGLLAPTAAQGQPSPQDRALRAQELRLQAEISLLQEHPELREDLDRAQSLDFRERGAAYRSLGAACTALDPQARGALQRYLVLSEDIERLRLGQGAPVDPQHPMLQDLWAALAESGAFTEGQAAIEVQAQLDTFPAARVPPGSAHSPLMRLELGAGVRSSPVGDAGTLSLGGQLYRYRLGERRHHGLAEGVELAAFPVQLQLSGPQAQAVQLRGAVLDYHRLFAQRRALNPGVVLRVLPVDLSSDAPSSAGPVALGGSLEVVQAGGHRHHLLLSASLSPMRLRWPGQEAGWVLGAPIVARGRLGSARHTMTALEGSVAWTPVLGAQSGQMTALSVQGQRRLAEVDGTDLALSLAFDALAWEVGADSGQAATLTLGLWMERF